MASWFSHMKPPPLIPTSIRTIQILAALHLFTESIGELRACMGFSMLPTLSHEGDIVLVSSIAYWRPAWAGGGSGARPKRGDLVVAASPLDPHQTVCKRVLGIEGDLVEIEPRRGSRAWANSNNNSSHGGHENRDSRHRVRVGEDHFVRVPRGHVWLAGDNLSNSTDSRTYGPVPLALVRGKVFARVWPTFTLFNNPIRPIGSSSAP